MGTWPNPPTAHPIELVSLSLAAGGLAGLMVFWLLRKVRQHCVPAFFMEENTTFCAGTNVQIAYMQLQAGNIFPYIVRAWNVHLIAGLVWSLIALPIS